MFEKKKSAWGDAFCILHFFKYCTYINRNICSPINITSGGRNKVKLFQEHRHHFSTFKKPAADKPAINNCFGHYSCFDMSSVFIDIIYTPALPEQYYHSLSVRPKMTPL